MTTAHYHVRMITYDASFDDYLQKYLEVEHNSGYALLRLDYVTVPPYRAGAYSTLEVVVITQRTTREDN